MIRSIIRGFMVFIACASSYMYFTFSELHMKVLLLIAISALVAAFALSITETGDSV